MNDTFEVIAGDVLVRDGRIVAVGAVFSAERVDRAIEAHGAFLLPGAHPDSHSSLPDAVPRLCR